MKIIIDECVPNVVIRGLPERNIVSVQQMGWAVIKNGELLKLVSEKFDVFVSSDKNLRFQQNLSSIDLTVVILPSNQVPAVRLILPELDKALETISGKSVIVL